MLSVRSSDPLGIMDRMEMVSGVCDRHGAFTTFRLVGTEAHTCPKCFDESLRQQTAAAKFRDLVAHLQAVSHVPARYANTGFSNFVVSSQRQRVAVDTITKFMRAVRDAAASPVWQTLLVSGGVGTGKTHLACALANNLISRGVGVRYTTTQDMLADIKRAYSTDGITEASQIERYVHGSTLLILDEADVTRGTDNDVTLLFAVLNGRYNAGLPMAVICNQPADELAAFLGDRSASRLMERATTVACDWADHRRAA